jgi:hypothetical protein
MSNPIVVHVQITGDGISAKQAIGQTVAELQRLQAAGVEASVVIGGIAKQQRDQLAVTEQSVVTYNLAVAALKKMGLAAADMSAALNKMGLANVAAAVAAEKAATGTAAATREISALEKALGAGTSGASRLRFSLITLLDSVVGLPGPLGRVSVGLGSLAFGSVEVLGVLAGVAAIVGVYDVLTAHSREVQKATDDLSTSLIKNRNARLGLTAAADITSQLAEFDRLRAEQKALQNAPPPSEFQIAKGLVPDPSIAKQTLAELAEKIAVVRRNIEDLQATQRESVATTETWLQILQQSADAHGLDTSQLKKLAELQATYTAALKAAKAAEAAAVPGSLAFADALRAEADANEHLATIQQIRETNAPKATDRAAEQALALEKARDTAIKQSGADAVALAKAEGNALVEAARISFDQGKSSVEQFFAARRQALDLEFAAELAAARENADATLKAFENASIAAAEHPKDITLQERVVTTQTAATTAARTVHTLEIQLSTALLQLDQDRLTAKKHLTEEELRLSGATEDGESGRLAKALAEIKLRADALRLVLQQLNADPARIDAAVNQLVTQDTAKAQLDDLTRQADLLDRKITANQQRLNLQVKQGTLTKGAAQDQQKAFAQSASGEADTLLSGIADASKGVTDPEVLAGFDALKTRVEKVTTATTAATGEMHDLERAALDATGKDVVNFFDSIVSGSQSAADAFRAMALSIVKDVGNIIAHFLIEKEITAVLGLSAGGSVPTPALHLASGGRVPGVGSSDTVPAMLTPGEFVLSRRMVADLGPDFFEHLRVGLQTPPLRSYYTGYNIGGPVLAPVSGPGQSDTQVGVLIDAHPDLIVRAMKTTQGQRALLQAMHANRRAVKEITK